jgi:hypothetical protein
MGRFAITSEIGTWLIYCEKLNELAVIAFKSEIKSCEIDNICQELNAVSVAAAITKPLSFIFTSGALPKDWPDALIRAYSNS